MPPTAEEVEGFQGAAFAGFDFDGEDEPALGNHEIDFGVGIFIFVQPVEHFGRGLGVEAEVLGDELFGQGAFVDKRTLLDGLKLDPIVAEQTADQSHIEKIEFQDAGVHARAKGDAGAIAGVDGQGDLSLDEQLEELSGMGAGSIGKEMCVFCLLAQVEGEVAKKALQVGQIGLAGVFGEIIDIGVENAVLNTGDGCEVAGGGKALDGLGHSAHEEILTLSGQESFMGLEGEGGRALEVEGFQPFQGRRVHDLEELAESHGLEEKILDAADGHRKGFAAEGELEQGSCGDDGQLWAVLEKIPKRLQCVGRGLNFIQEDQCPGPDAPSADGLQVPKDETDIQPGKNPVHIPMPLKIDFEEVQAVLFGEEPNESGFAYLSGPSQHEGFPDL